MRVSPALSRLSGTVVAIAATAAVAALRFVLADWLGQNARFLPFVFAVLVSAYYGGLVPGLVATALSGLASVYLYDAPNDTFLIVSRGELLGLLILLALGGTTSWLCEALHAARRRSDAERERLEAERRERQQSEQRFSRFMEHLPGLAWIKDADGRYAFANEAAVRAFRTAADALYGKTDEELFDRETADQFRANDALALASARGVQVIEQLKQEDGVVHSSIVSKFPIPGVDGKAALVGGMAIDITNLRQAEEALRRQEERMRLLWEAAAVLLTTHQPDAMLQTLFKKIAPQLGLDAYFNFMVNEAGDALRLVSCAGIPPEAARSITRLEFGQAICGTVAQRRQAIVATEIQSSLDPKVQLVKSFGLRAYACNPLMAGDSLLGTLSFASHSRDRFEPDELDFLATISHYVTAAYERLRLIEQLQQADQRKDEFLATLAHELRNPLAPIRNGLEILRLAGAGEAEVGQVRAMIERQVRQLVRLIDDLLDVSRIVRDKLTLRKERVELAGVVHSAVETSRPLIEWAQHRLAVELPGHPVYLDGDPTRLAQVFANLLNNAAKYTEPGGQIWLRAAREGSDVVVSVRDTGVGIPQGMLPRVFEMFTQVDRSLERSQGGLGLGLSIVKRLVELHGGSVEVRSEGHGQGSEFKVRLPIVILRASQETSPPRAPDSTLRKHACRVLVVDDNVDAAQSLAQLLRLMGHETQIAHDGLEGVLATDAFRPDVVLLDIGLPKLNGYETARRIRGQPWGEAICLVALTGWGQEEDKRLSKEAGFDEHLTKPVDPGVLEELLRTWCTVTV